jgi:MFS family permease
MIGSAAAIGGGIGTMLGGLIVDHLTWHWIFYSSSAMSALAFVLILCLPSFKPAPSSGKLDVLGGLLFVGGIGSLLGGLSFGQSWGWFSASTLGLVFCGFLILVFWWRYELRLANPLLDVRLLVNRQVALANVAFFLLAAGAMNSMQILMVLLQQPTWTLIGLGISATLAGLLKFPSSLISAAAGTWGGMIATRHGGRAALLVATVIVMAAWGALAINHGSVTIVILMMLLAACGMVISYGAVANLVVEATPAARTSEATGLLQVSKSTGMVIGSQVLALLMASSTISDAALGPGRFPDALAYDRAILFVMAVSAIAILAAWLLPRRERHPVDSEQPVSKALA